MSKTDSVKHADVGENERGFRTKLNSVRKAAARGNGSRGGQTGRI